MHSIRRSCLSALRNPSGACVYADGSRRAFSRSVARSKGGLPVYLEPSSTELSSLLANINSKVLLPGHLSREQKKLVYQQKSRPKLETEPVEVTIGDVTLPLEHIDRNLLPSRWQSLKDVVRQSETTADWENVVRVLEGLHSAGFAIKPQWQDLVVRKLNENGHHALVLKALQRVKATGLHLSNYSVTKRALKGAHDRAANAGWAKAETAKALRYARQIVELMEEEEHHAVSSRGKMAVENDWRSKPYVIAAPTELAAVAAQRHGGDVEIVKTLANRLVSALKQDNFTESVDRIVVSNARTEADFKNKSTQTLALNDCCEDLFELLTIWNALKTSKSVLGADMPLATEAAEFEDRIKTAVLAGIEGLPKLQSRDGVDLRSSYPAYIRDQLKKVTDEA
ncbi:uncharacterized protein EKO05_0010193 [Ascochyta rabiei]|uniref:Uncharacterized protein n=1 Tax=Didymella rabiei TaxID=5454 RepID=A0A162WMG3_DIDRA|nr:uncharacterized protein EKO05_0010193 [Ascochyta rabiei]KZM19114.1 hypothetical protein ST47_g9734 [Ascochyta rabiei]UPX19944.1 hypothetical protein EKO05_0010193 [Ascochyta rabiei]